MVKVMARFIMFPSPSYALTRIDIARRREFQRQIVADAIILVGPGFSIRNLVLAYSGHRVVD
jgi:hypothetical protein